MFNRKSFESFFHKIHNHLRNGETALTGMAALNEINNFIMLIFIEPRIDEIFKDDDEVDKLKFSYLCKLVDIYENSKGINEERNNLENILENFSNIIEKYYNNYYLKKYLETEASRVTVFSTKKTFYNYDDVDKFFNMKNTLYEILKDCRQFIFKDKEINNENITNFLNNLNTDIIGDAYEKFKENEVGNQGKTMGQYFSPRSIIKYCVEENIKPKYNELCYDSSVGTGGFLHYLNKYVKEHSTKEEHNYYKEHNIYANDKTEEIMKPLYINLLLHDIGISNIKNRNSLGYENCEEYFEKFDNFVGNPPYGLKHKAKYDDYDFKTCGKIFYFPKFMKSGNFLVKDSMGQFMIHCVNSLKVNGKFSLIIDRGILNNGTENNSWQKNLREWLLCNCKIKKIVLLPKGIFSTTNFDTAVIHGIKKVPFKDNHLKKLNTKKIKYYLGKFEDEKNKTGLIVEKEPDMILEIKDIVNNNFSLKYDDYVEKEELTYNGIPYKTLGEVCDFQIGSTPSTKIAEYYKNGNYLWCSVGDLNYNIINDTSKKLTEKAINESRVKLVKKGTLMMSFKLSIGKLGFAGKDMYCNEAIAFFDNYKFVSKKYLFYILLILDYDKQKHLFNSQISKSLNKSTLSKLKIPILPESHQQEIVEFMDRCLEGDYSILNRLVKEFSDIDTFKFLLVKDWVLMEYTINYIKELINYETILKRTNEIEKKLCFKGIKAEYKTLGEVCDISKGNFNTKNISNCGTIPYFNSGGNNPVSVHDHFTIDHPEYIIFVKDGGDKNNKFNMNSGMAKSYYVKGKSAIISHNLILKPKDYIKCIFLHYYLCADRKNIMKLAKYNSGLGHITKTKYEKIKIPVPSLEEQEKIVNEIKEIEKVESEYLIRLNNKKEKIKLIINIIDIDNEIELEEQKINKNNKTKNEQKILTK